MSEAVNTQGPPQRQNRWINGYFWRHGWNLRIHLFRRRLNIGYSRDHGQK